MSFKEDVLFAIPLVLKKIFLNYFILNLLGILGVILTDAFLSLPFKGIFAILVMSDMVTGIWKATCQKDISKKKAQRGLVNIAIQLFVAILAGIFVIMFKDKSNILIASMSAFDLFDDFVMISLIIYNCISNFENLFEVAKCHGIDIPILSFICQFFRIAQSTLNKKFCGLTGITDSNNSEPAPEHKV